MASPHEKGIVMEQLFRARFKENFYEKQLILLSEMESNPGPYNRIDIPALRTQITDQRIHIRTVREQLERQYEDIMNNSAKGNG